MELYPFQKEGVTRLVQSQLLILADEMGLGKTVQVISGISELFSSRAIQRVLVVCPASLMYNWKAEFQKWAPATPTILYRGADRYGMLDGRSRVLISSYDTLINDLKRRTNSGDLFVDIGVDLIVLDEGQFIKSPETSRSRVASRVIAPRRWVLSGTPMENHPKEMGSVLRFLCPNEFSADADLLDFGKIFNNRNKYMLRRTKEEVRLDLPKKIVSNTPTSMSPGQESEYVHTQEDIRAKLLASKSLHDVAGVLLGGIQNLRRIATISSEGESGKLDFLDADLEALRSTEDKILMFSSFPGIVIPHLLERFSEFNPVSFTGAMTLTERDNAYEQFINDPQCRMMCASIRAAGVGLTWTVARFVYHVDLWWNPQVLKQAEDRAHRIGQTETVIVKRLLSEDSIDIGISRLLEMKQEIFDCVVEGKIPARRQRSVLDTFLPEVGLSRRDLRVTKG